MKKITVQLPKKPIPLLDQVSNILPMKYRNATNDNILLQPFTDFQVKKLEELLDVKVERSFEKMRYGRRHWYITNDNNEQVDIIKERYSNDYIVTVG